MNPAQETERQACETKKGKTQCAEQHRFGSIIGPIFQRSVIGQNRRKGTRQVKAKRQTFRILFGHGKGIHSLPLLDSPLGVSVPALPLPVISVKIGSYTLTRKLDQYLPRLVSKKEIGALRTTFHSDPSRIPIRILFLSLLQVTVV